MRSLLQPGAAPGHGNARTSWALLWAGCAQALCIAPKSSLEAQHPCAALSQHQRGWELRELWDLGTLMLGDPSSGIPIPIRGMSGVFDLLRLGRRKGVKKQFATHAQALKKNKPTTSHLGFIQINQNIRKKCKAPEFTLHD